MSEKFGFGSAQEEADFYKDFCGKLQLALQASAREHLNSAKQFTFYMEQHRAKSPPDLIKAIANNDEALRCSKAAVAALQAAKV